MAKVLPETYTHGCNYLRMRSVSITPMGSSQGLVVGVLDSYGHTPGMVRFWC